MMQMMRFAKLTMLAEVNIFPSLTPQLVIIYILRTKKWNIRSKAQTYAKNSHYLAENL